MRLNKYANSLASRDLHGQAKQAKGALPRILVGQSLTYFKRGGIMAGGKYDPVNFFPLIYLPKDVANLFRVAVLPSLGITHLQLNSQSW